MPFGCSASPLGSKGRLTTSDSYTATVKICHTNRFSRTLRESDVPPKSVNFDRTYFRACLFVDTLCWGCVFFSLPRLLDSESSRNPVDGNQKARICCPAVFFVSVRVPPPVGLGFFLPVFHRLHSGSPFQRRCQKLRLCRARRRCGRS